MCEMGGEQTFARIEPNDSLGRERAKEGAVAASNPPADTGTEALRFHLAMNV